MDSFLFRDCAQHISHQSLCLHLTPFSFYQLDAGVQHWSSSIFYSAANNPGQQLQPRPGPVLSQKECCCTDEEKKGWRRRGDGDGDGEMERWRKKGRGTWWRRGRKECVCKCIAETERRWRVRRRWKAEWGREGEYYCDWRFFCKLFFFADSNFV